MISLTVVFSSGEQHDIQISAGATVQNVVYVLKVKYALPINPDTLQLVHNGSVLNDERATLEQLGVKDGAVLEAIVGSSPAGMKMPVDRELPDFFTELSLRHIRSPDWSGRFDRITKEPLDEPYIGDIAPYVSALSHHESREYRDRLNEIMSIKNIMVVTGKCGHSFNYAALEYWWRHDPRCPLLDSQRCERWVPSSLSVCAPEYRMEILDRDRWSGCDKRAFPALWSEVCMLNELRDGRMGTAEQQHSMAHELFSGAATADEMKEYNEECAHLRNALDNDLDAVRAQRNRGTF